MLDPLGSCGTVGSMKEDTHLRLPLDLKQWLMQFSHDNYQSLNGTVVRLLTQVREEHEQAKIRS
jgi:hypothetical protein